MLKGGGGAPEDRQEGHPQCQREGHGLPQGTDGPAARQAGRWSSGSPRGWACSLSWRSASRTGQSQAPWQPSSPWTTWTRPGRCGSTPGSGSSGRAPQRGTRRRRDRNGGACGGDMRAGARPVGTRTAPAAPQGVDSPPFEPHSGAQGRGQKGRQARDDQVVDMTTAATDGSLSRQMRRDRRRARRRPHRRQPRRMRTTGDS